MSTALTSADVVRGIDLKAADSKHVRFDINLLRLKALEYLSEKKEPRKINLDAQTVH